MSASATYRGVVVAVDPLHVDAATIGVGTTLGDSVGSTELLSVVPVDGPTAAVADHLAAAAAGIGVPQLQRLVIESDEPAAAIIDHVGHDRLLVMGCGATHPIWTHDAGDVGRSVLRVTRQPVLVVGPSVARPLAIHAPLVVCAGDHEPSSSIVTAVDRWVSSFGAANTWVVRVVPTASEAGAAPTRMVEQWAETFRRSGSPAQARVLHGGDPIEWLDDFAARFDSGIYVISSGRYTDGRRHLHSTTRDLIRRGRHPVFVVPSRAQEDCADPPTDASPFGRAAGSRET